MDRILTHNTLLSLVLGIALASFLGAPVAVAEVAPPPIGGPGAEGIPATPPPLGGDFEEDDFVDPGDNFGFGQPGAVPPAMPPSNPPSANTYPGADAAPPPGNSALGRTAPPPTRAAKNAPPRSSPGTPPASANSGASSATTSASRRPAPKLADYLQLDSSVKGLEVKNFDLPDKEIKDVVTLISKWTGKNFILDSKVRGKITILGPSQVTLQEAYQAFLSALEANGLTTVQAGKFIRVIESAEARRAPVETYAGDYAPTTDQFITRIFQLKYINSDEVQREFRDLTTRQGKLFAYEPTNSIIITDTGSNIARIQEILETLDVKGFETTLHVLRIKNTSSKAISEMLGEIYGDSSKGGGGASTGGPRSFRRSALERTRGGGIISKIIPDEQTNSLVVLANQAGFVQLRQLVEKLDVKVTDTGRIHVYYCEYAKAEDLASTLASLSGQTAGGKSSKGKGATGGGTAPTAGAPAGGGGAAGPVSAELEGGVRITSDAATNALVVTANSGDYQTLKRVIRKLDIPRLQVFVETAILEVSIDKTTSYGNNFGFGAPGRGLAGGFITDAKAAATLLTGGISEGAVVPILAGPSFSAPNPVNPTGPAITVTSFMQFLTFLTSNTSTSVLSTPQILALDNEKAEFKVQDETPVQTSFSQGLSQNGGIPGAAQGSIERLKTGIQIQLTPHVNAISRSIRMEIKQQVDSTKANSSVPQALANIQVATTSRLTDTSVVVRDQDFVMLGGLMSDKIDETVKKVPLLGDIPILGWLFKAKTYHATKSNLIILLRPRIIGSSVSSANVISKNFKGYDKFIDDNMSGKDPEEDALRERREEIEIQRNAPENDAFEHYRNNVEDDVDPNKPKVGDSELDTPKPDAGVSQMRKPPTGPRDKGLAELQTKAAGQQAAVQSAQPAAAKPSPEPLPEKAEEFVIPPPGENAP